MWHEKNFEQWNHPYKNYWNSNQNPCHLDCACKRWTTYSKEFRNRNYNCSGRNVKNPNLRQQREQIVLWRRLCNQWALRTKLKKRGNNLFPLRLWVERLKAEATEVRERRKTKKAYSFLRLRDEFEDPLSEKKATIWIWRFRFRIWILSTSLPPNASGKRRWESERVTKEEGSEKGFGQK